MNKRDDYAPGPAAGARVEKDGETWTLVLVRELRHSPTMVWEALTDPAQLSEWAPFDADRNLGAPGAVKLSTVGAPTPQVSETSASCMDSVRYLALRKPGMTNAPCPVTTRKGASLSP